jgi:hypothetical protein
MIKAENLVVGKRYWFDTDKNISGVFKGRFNQEIGSDYLTFDNIIKSETYDGLYRERNGEAGFTYMEELTFPECEITCEQLELTF